MRYQIGEKILAIGFYHESDKATKTLINSIGYVVASPDLEWKFKIIELEVTEHHKVPVSYYENEGNTADGYVLKSGDLVFHNQYPTASYGQLSDAANRVFSLKFEPGTLKDQVEKHIVLRYTLLSEQYEFLRNDIHRDREPAVVEQLARLVKEIDQEIAERFKVKMQQHQPYSDHPDMIDYIVVPLN